MPAQDFLASLRWSLWRILEEINERVTLSAVQTIGVLLTRHRHLPDLLAQLYPRLIVYLHHLVDATQRRLSLARYEMRSNAEAVDSVILNQALSFSLPIRHSMLSTFLRQDCRDPWGAAGPYCFTDVTKRFCENRLDIINTIRVCFKFYRILIYSQMNLYCTT